MFVRVLSEPYSGSATNFCNVNNNGNTNNNSASSAGGVAPDSVRRTKCRSLAILDCSDRYARHRRRKHPSVRKSAHGGSV